MRFEGFVGGFGEGRSPSSNLERCVNLFPELTAGSGKSKAHYVGTPGKSLFCTAMPTGPVRCLWAGDDRVFAVIGGWYGEVFYNGGAPWFSQRAVVVNDGKKAYIYSNATETGVGSQLIVVSGGKLYCDIGSSVIQQAVPGNVSSATYLDGYFIALERDSNAVYISGLLDGTSWNPLDKQARLSSSDRLVAIAADKKLLWLFGKRNIDPWYNSGNADFPFEPVQGAHIRCGTVAAHTIEELDDGFFFMQEDDRGGVSVVRTEGYSVKPISTPAISAAISNQPLDQYSSWTYEEDGHKFYHLTDYGGASTYAYDVATGLWHERAHWTGSAFEADLGRCHCYTTPGYSGLGGQHLVGAWNSGKIYTQSLSLYTDAGQTIRRYRQTPYIGDRAFAVTIDGVNTSLLSINDAFVDFEKGNGWNFFHEFELDMDIVGSPNIRLKWLKDDGLTWSNEKTPVLLAGDGYKKRVIWRRLGRSRAKA